MKLKVVVLGLFVVGSLTLSKIISIPADPPKFNLPPFAAKAPNYFPPFPPPVENKLVYSERLS